MNNKNAEIKKIKDKKVFNPNPTINGKIKIKPVLTSPENNPIAKKITPKMKNVVDNIFILFMI